MVLYSGMSIESRTGRKTRRRNRRSRRKGSGEENAETEEKEVKDEKTGEGGEAAKGSTAAKSISTIAALVGVGTWRLDMVSSIFFRAHSRTLRPLRCHPVSSTVPFPVSSTDVRPEDHDWNSL